MFPLAYREKINATWVKQMLMAHHPPNQRHNSQQRIRGPPTDPTWRKKRKKADGNLKQMAI